MIYRPKSVLMSAALFVMFIALFVQGATQAQQSASGSAIQKMGPVGEDESKPSIASPPVASVVDPGIIPSRQAITPAGLQSIFDSRVNGVVFGENGDSIYAATVGQKAAYVYQINLKTNQMMNVLSTTSSPGMQGLTYDPVSRTPLLSGLAGNGKGAA